MLLKWPHNSVMASTITGNLPVCSRLTQRKHHSSLAFCERNQSVNGWFPHKVRVMWKVFRCPYVIMRIHNHPPLKHTQCHIAQSITHIRSIHNTSCKGITSSLHHQYRFLYKLSNMQGASTKFIRSNAAFLVAIILLQCYGSAMEIEIKNMTVSHSTCDSFRHFDKEIPRMHVSEQYDLQ